uniref:Uncharacterized protein n=1 Tax=Glossina palpalis gambiensis TaxID=67801 RepID=A0A1B0BXX8_9MUSC
MVEVLNNIDDRPAYEKKIMSLKHFPKSKRLRMLAAERKQTRYGVKIMLHLEDHVMFLPDKFNAIDDDKDLSSKQIGIGEEMINNERNYNFNFKRVEQ